MPKKWTRKATPFTSPMTWAGGLHDPVTGKTYLFRSFKHHPITIGRKPSCDIRLKDERVSNVHAVIKCPDAEFFVLHDAGSTNGTRINKQRVTTPVPLVTGMQIRIGRTRLLAVDELGSFPLTVHSIGELCFQAVATYGSYREAARRIGMSHTFVSKHANEWRHDQLYGTPRRPVSDPASDDSSS